MGKHLKKWWWLYSMLALVAVLVIATVVVVALVPPVLPFILGISVFGVSLFGYLGSLSTTAAAFALGGIVASVGVSSVLSIVGLKKQFSKLFNRNKNQHESPFPDDDDFELPDDDMGNPAANPYAHQHMRTPEGGSPGAEFNEDVHRDRQQAPTHQRFPELTDEQLNAFSGVNYFSP